MERCLDFSDNPDAPGLCSVCGHTRSAHAQPPAAPVETEDYSFGEDYGRDLLTDLNRLAHHRGTKTLHRDALQRSFKEITRLRKQLSKLTCVPRSSAEPAAPVETKHIQCERCGDVAIASGRLCDDCAELSIPDQRSSAGSGAVNGLGWLETTVDRGDGTSEFSGFEAETPFGTFYVIEIHGDAFTVEYDMTKIGEADTPDEAKRIGQRDFERRIRMALIPVEPQAAPISVAMDALVSVGNQDAFLDMPRYTRNLVNRAIEKLAGVAEQSGAGAPETSVRCGAPAATTPPQPMPVRALDWQETFTDRGDGSSDHTGWEAPSGFGPFYEIDQYFGSDSYVWQVRYDLERIGDFDDPDQAKACAQEHFAERVTSALTRPQSETGK